MADEFGGTEEFGMDEPRREYEEEGFVRVRMPRPGEVLGVVEQRLGASKMRVRCMDGKNRLCCIPGSKKKYLWIREGDTVLVIPWVLSGATKGDVVHKYKPNQVKVLRKKGLIKEEIEEEF